MSILADLLALKAKTSAPALTVTEAKDLSDEEIHGMVKELEHLHETMVKAIHEAKDLVRHLPSQMRGQAESYWIPHIMIALGGEHDYMASRSESTMMKTIEELKEEAGSDEGHGDHDSDEDFGGHEGDEDRHLHAHSEHGSDPMGRHHGRN